MAFTIVFAGTPEFAAVALEAMVAAGFAPSAVYTQPDRPAGRGMKLMPSAVKQRAVQHAIPVYQPASLKPVEAQAELAALRPDVMVVAAYGLLLPQAVLDIPRLGCINIHGSLLPRWRGAAPIHRAIEAGDVETGIGIMQMEAGLDTGPVLLERRLTIDPHETTGSLHDRMAMLGAAAIVETLRVLAVGETLTPCVQPSEGVTYAHKITSEEAAIDWTQPATVLDRKIRAFNPAPGAWTLWQGEKLKLWVAEPLMERQPSNVRVGQVLAVDKQGLRVATGEGSLLLHEVQRAGGKRMPVSAWLAGGSHPQAGEQLGC